jgi:uncharacterized protein DUF6498
MSEPPIYARPEPSAQGNRVPPSAYVLLATNAIPLIGVVLRNWTVFQVLLLYWSENVVVGGFNVLRMLTAQPESESFSFFHNYLARGEYQRVLLPQLMFQPYGRNVVLHLTVLLGGFLVMALGSPVVAIVLLVGLKTAIDLGAHLKERVKLGGRNSGQGSDVGSTVFSPRDP